MVRRVSLLDTYNLSVDDCHAYFVGSAEVLVHNAGETSHLVYFGYAPTDLVNLIYIGQTNDIIQRQKDHRADAIAEPENTV